MHKRFDPPTRKTYFGMIISAPFLVLFQLWQQDDLSIQTAALTLGVTGLLYFNLRWIQDFFRDDWRLEYEQKLTQTLAELERKDLTPKERRRLERYRNELPIRYHLVTSPDETYRKIRAFGLGLKVAASTIRHFVR